MGMPPKGVCLGSGLQLLRIAAAYSLILAILALGVFATKASAQSTKTYGYSHADR